jgi:hypothetical protein
MLTPLLVLIVLLLLFGAGGFAVHFLWDILVVAVIIWLIGFFVRGAERRWYRW